jgi:hypothetical protein
MFLLKNLTRFNHEHLVLILKHKIISWSVMSSVRRNQTPLSYTLKWVNEANENYKSLITLKHVRFVTITLLVFVAFR